MIKSFFLIAMFTFLAAFISCHKKNVEPIKIGAALPLTGPIAQNGIYYREGLELALSDAIKDKLIPENTIKLIIEDGQASPVLCVNMAN